MDHAAWLASTTEDVLDPDLAICDPHHHLWIHPKNTYMLDELRSDTGAGHKVESTVFVECMSGYLAEGPEELRPVGETRFVAEVAEVSAATDGAEIAGIVSYADMALGDSVEAVLSAHIESGAGRFRGIRHATGWDASERVHNSHTNPTEDLMAQPEFRAGLRKLGSMGLSFDAWLYHPQLAQFAELAEAVPEVPIVLDHLGAPLGVGPYKDRRAEVREAWRPAMERIARCENVSLKVGGIGMAIYGDGWHKRDTAPSSDDLTAAWGDDVRWTIDKFGPNRCMFESNFPVDKQGVSYPVLWNAFKKIAVDYSPAERVDLFAGTAKRFYRI